uniref:Pre-mRNA-processing factor 17 n=1 Tax=Lygus hesperus TaxID=30085 RepID=A0A0A9VVB6_LYGHE
MRREQAVKGIVQDDEDELKDEKNQEPVMEEVCKVLVKYTKTYDGRTLLSPPPGVRPPHQILPTLQCYIPKQRYYTYTGHEKGVPRIRFVTQYGHMLLSCSFDNTVRLWNVMNQRECIQVYNGHNQGIRDMQVTDDGKHFMTVSYDKYVKIWDTETGQVLTRIMEKMPGICCAFHPKRWEEVLIGYNNRLVQWDTRTKEIVQEYTDPMGPVNTLTFINEDTFIATSDDKHIRVYDYGIPVVIKDIHDTELHSITSVAIHPSHKYLVGNAQNNRIIILALQDRVKLNRRKVFSGHVTSGFSCGLHFSPDGRF